MSDKRTPVLELRIREPGSSLPAHLTNTWGERLNAELARIDAAIGNVCTTSQVMALRQLIVSRDSDEGVIL